MQKKRAPSLPALRTEVPCVEEDVYVAEMEEFIEVELPREWIEVFMSGVVIVAWVLMCFSFLKRWHSGNSAYLWILRVEVVVTVSSHSLKFI